MSSNITWNDVVKKEARGINNEDFGEVQDVSDGYVFIQKGMFNKDKFFIPQNKVESFDGDILRFRVSAKEALNSYQMDFFPSSSSSSFSSTPPQYSNQKSEEEEEEITMPVKEEKLDIDKRVEEKQNSVTKELVTETKSVKIP
jgi:hypothetical protein